MALPLWLFAHDTYPPGEKDEIMCGSPGDRFANVDRSIIDTDSVIGNLKNVILIRPWPCSLEAAIPRIHF